MVLIIFFVSLLVISAASATDNDANDVVNVVDNNTDDVVSVEETSNGIFNTEDDNDVDYSQNNNVLLSSKETDDLNTVEFNSSSANYLICHIIFRFQIKLLTMEVLIHIYQWWLDLMQDMIMEGMIFI